jgi:hypothetical protein
MKLAEVRRDRPRVLISLLSQSGVDGISCAFKFAKRTGHYEFGDERDHLDHLLIGDIDYLCAVTQGLKS